MVKRITGIKRTDALSYQITTSTETISFSYTNYPRLSIMLVIDNGAKVETVIKAPYFNEGFLIGLIGTHEEIDTLADIVRLPRGPYYR